MSSDRVPAVINMVGDYLFTDKNFMNRLATKNPNIFQKVWDEIKYMVKIAAAGSNEKKKLLQVQKAFEDAYHEATQKAGKAEQRQEQKNTAEDGGVKYSLRYLAAETNTEILEMVTRVIDGDFSSNSKVHLGVVPDGVAKTISGITGIDVQGFDMAIEARMVDHILKGHGKNGDADHSMQDPKHLARIQYVLFHADDIRDAGRTSAYTHFKNGKSRPAPTVLYEKSIGEKSYYVVQAVPDTKAKTLYVVSAFIGPEGYRKEASQLINAQGPDATANTDSVVASKNSIRNQEPDVKHSLSNGDALPMRQGNYHVSGEEIAFEELLPMHEIEEMLEVLEQMEAAQLEQNVSNVAEEELLPMAQEKIFERFQNSRKDKAQNLQKLIEANQRYAEAFSREIAEKEAQLAAMEHPYSKEGKQLRSEIEQLQQKLANVEKDLAKRQEALTQAQQEATAAEVTEEPVAEETQSYGRRELHEHIVDRVKESFAQKGMDFDQVLKNAKNLSTWSTVDNTPQRVMEKALGYKEGGILADLTVNKVAQNETEGIKWLNSFTDRKNGLLKQISDQYHIKPGSKESAAAQMYAEGFYVNEKNEIIRYGDPELIQDFPDANVRQNIKGLARDPRIRQIYDETLAKINDSRTRNAYPEIPRLDNYFLHFRAMDDTFSRLGLPFNPNDIRAKDLPTDLNGVTADLKPGQPYFASAKHRTGKMYRPEQDCSGRFAIFCSLLCTSAVSYRSFA